ncbi:MAG TPA: hypothetical protein VGH85_23870 [Mycobacteriales bacterium]
MTRAGPGQPTAPTRLPPQPAAGGADAWRMLRQKHAVRAVGAATVVAVALVIVWLVLPLMGTDLSAQVERAQFFARHGLRPIDFGWYGGTNQFGYSLVSPAVMATIGVRLTGALAAVGAAMAFAAILARTGARRPVLGGVVGAVCITANLASGRITYALGLAFGLAGILALTDRNPRRRLILASIATLLASSTSPVAGLFVGLAGATLLLTGRRREGLVLGISAVLPILVVSGLFGEGGWMNISRADAVHAVVLSLVVLLLVPHRVVRVGAALSAVGVLAAFAIHTPVGLNAIRLAVMFAVPLIVALARGRLVVIAVIGALLVWWQPPVMTGDLRDDGNPTASAAYYTPLLTELDRLPPAGRVEIPPTRDYWEADYVAAQVPIGRGWLRQIDIDRDPLFFDGPVSADAYRHWLDINGVSYVALSDATPSWVGTSEAAVIRGRPGFLHPLWHDQHWTLYSVLGAPGMVDPPAKLRAATQTGVTVSVGRPGLINLRVRFSRWLTVDHAGACIEPGSHWSVLKVTTPGTYQVSSRLQFGQPERCP